MATYLYRLGKTAYRRWPVFIAAWIAVFVVVGGVAGAFSKPTTDAFTIPGIPSEEAADLQAELFPDSVDAFDEASVNVVVAAPEGEKLADYAPEVAALTEALRGVDQMPAPETVVDPVAAAAEAEEQGGSSGGKPAEQPAEDDASAGALAALAPISADGRIGAISFAFDVDTVTDVEPATQEEVKEVMADARASGLTVEANGQGMGEFAPPGGAAELIGIGLALVVLVLTFGSLVAAGLPVIAAIIGVGLGMTGITAATAFMDIGSSAPILATMIGLAVGIDYSLFILARYRSELEHTEDRREAVGIAVGTAGSAVVFAGLTVLIALAALTVVRIPFLTTMGLAAAATVFLAVLVALTLLPAILGMLKSKAFGGQVRKYRPAREDDGRIVNNGVRWARFVGRKPLVVVLLVVVGLGALAIPLKDLFLAFPTDSTASPSTTQRKASDLLTEGFGPGREAPFQIVADLRDVAEADRPAATQEVIDWAAKQDGVAGVLDATALDPEQAEAAAEAGGTTLLLVPEFGPDDPRTQDLLTALRDGEDGIEADTGTDIGITGLTAITTDVSDRLNGALVPYLAVVVGLAFILLMIVFRSLLVPLTATFGFLLSVLATLGTTVVIFQEGTFGIMEGQPIVSFMPIFLIGVVFGLAMDYQVFLVTRMREAHVHGASPRDAVVDGFRSSARVVAAAAIIMTAVFSGFILEDDAIIKSMGFALAVAVLFDAFVVRMTLIPALMYLLGEKAWYLPAWLDKILPDVDVEGEKLERPHLADARAPEPDLAR
ncbi:MMPL family transporter [Nocardioides dongxiaopingii]|uniref:MMPL family transporter n=1 Tax=Nocardioides sp. S-1144 TaxID=2582905 RepID=UPI00116363E5|nr:MMPL family transporter [Nocardioides sp. S-1144]QDH10671.1 MMPL family transporter [Nocardioides sp. S-1144]